MFWNKKTEFTEDHECIFESRINLKTFSVHGYQLGTSADLVDTSKIIETTFHKYPKEATKFIYENGKVFYQLDGKIIEYPLVKRINSVLKTDGWFQMKEGYSIRLEKGTVVEFMLGKILPEKITSMQQSDIPLKFGQPTKTEENYEDVDGSLINTDYIYLGINRFTITYDEWDKKISRINIGEPMKRDY